MKKNNTAQKTVLEAQKISKALKEGTEKTLQNLIKEAIDDAIGASEEEEVEEEPIEEDSYEVQDVETEETPTDDEPETDDVDGGEDAALTDEDDADAEDEWSDMEQYKVGDNDYDFTGVDGETALKVYNKLGDDDQIFVQKKDDGTYEVKDEESGAEFVIELEPDGEEDVDADVDTDEPVEDDDTDIEIDMDSDVDEPVEDDDEIEIDMDSDVDEPVEDDDEIEIDLDDEETDDENDELNEEKQEFTDSYQKDVMPGLNMKEPADKKATNDWDGGVPQGAEKPWVGKGESKPFEKKVNERCKEGKCCGKSCKEEIEEGTNVGGAVQQRSMSKSNIPAGRKEYGPKVKHNVSAAGEETAQINESKVRRIVEAAKAIQAENKKYQEVISEIKKSLYEAAILNINYGKIVDLMLNETTTKEEKKSIVERFGQVKTINEGKQLYESIKRELNESTKKNTPMLDEQISVESSKTINETKIYQNNPSLNLMERMDNLFTKNKK